MSQRTLIEEIATRFAESAPDGWSRVHAEIQAIKGLTGFTVTATLESGVTTSYLVEDDDANHSVHDLIEELRGVMGRENGERGAWYTMSVDVTADGRFSVEFDYDSKPDFDFEVTAESLREDLEAFPRSPEHVPAWLREALRR